MYEIKGVSVKTIEGGIACVMYHNGGLNEVIDFDSGYGTVHALKLLSRMLPKQPGFTVRWYESKRLISRASIPYTFNDLDRLAVVVPTVLD